MVFLHKLSRFTKNKQDLKKIYILQIRSKLEQSAVLWHSSITQKCENNLESVQKSALRIVHCITEIIKTSIIIIIIIFSFEIF